MRWKAKIDDPSGCITLQRVVGTFARLVKSRDCRLRLSPDKLYLVDLGDSDENAKIWSEIDRTNLFSTYKIESAQSNNEILLVINVEQLSRALKSTVAATSVTFKLSKKDDVNFMSLIIGTKSVIGADRPISQDIPIQICHHSDIDQIQPPALPNPEINIYLPAAKMLRNVVERMKALSELVVVSANGVGELTLKVETSVVTVKTFFKDLQNAEWKEDEGPTDASQAVLAARPKEDFLDATIPVKNLHAFIAANQPDSTSILLSIVHGKTVVLSVIHDESTLTLYIPVHNDD